MIDIGKILKRSWHILWNYRMLWIFGILLALTAGSRGGGNSGSGYQAGSNNANNGNNGFDPGSQLGPWGGAAKDWFTQNGSPLFEHPEHYVATFIWIGVAILVFILLVVIVTSLIRYPSETAVIRLVDEYEQTGVKMGFRQGWKLGWNRRAFRIWVIDLLISLPAFVFIALLLGVGLMIYFSVTSGGTALAVSGTIAAIGCAFLFIFAFVLLMVFLGLLRQFFIRAAALEGTRIGESIRAGWALFKRNWKSAGLMWLVMIGIGIGAGIAGLILFFLLIPAYLVLFLPATLVAGIPALIAFGLTSIFASSPVTWIVAAVVAVPFLLLIIFAPLSLVNGWYMIFSSGVWTLTYREIKALETVTPQEMPVEKA